MITRRLRSPAHTSGLAKVSESVSRNTPCKCVQYSRMHWSRTCASVWVGAATRAKCRRLLSSEQALDSAAPSSYSCGPSQSRVHGSVFASGLLAWLWIFCVSCSRCFLRDRTRDCFATFHFATCLPARESSALRRSIHCAWEQAAFENASRSRCIVSGIASVGEIVVGCRLPWRKTGAQGNL